MKITPLIVFSFTVQLCFGQSNPTASRTDVSINRLMTVKMLATQIAKNPVDGKLYYMDLTGNIFRVDKSGTTWSDDTVYTAVDHGIFPTSLNFPGPQGMAFHDSVLYVSGSLHQGDTITMGKIVKGVLQPNGSRVWSTVLTTDFYAMSPTPFNHGLSGMIVSPDGDSITFCIGSRTDHGESPRDAALTATLYRIPTNSSTHLQNDSAWLAGSGLVYAKGVRNTFAMAYDKDGVLFGADNSGERDQPDELNRLVKGKHYGFPYKMGNLDNPQQFSSYDPSSDKLVNHLSPGWRMGLFHNDPAFPSAPSVTFENSMLNSGPDADKVRNPTTGEVIDVSSTMVGGTSIRTFTPHSTPVGLMFDNGDILHDDFSGDGFMLRWNKGYNDSCGCRTSPDTAIGPFVDLAEDLLHLDFTGANTLSATSIVTGFANPVDAVMDSNKIYVIEFGFGTGGLYEVTLPVPSGIEENPSAGVRIKCYPNPAASTITFDLPARVMGHVNLTLFNVIGQPVKTVELQSGQSIQTVSVQELDNGFYVYRLAVDGNIYSGKFLIER